MKEISTEIEIEATPDRVWQVVSDFDAYPDWNPFTRDICGKAERGSKLKVRIESPGGRGMTSSRPCSRPTRSGNCPGSAAS
ncbi:MAG TPA: SRPBCC family protein [Gaiellaceae bacterium]|jgi:uncharacterized protein YndB with AHSA1/START domain|nr:SRPBCC family protein [Gaiellaceae bacterium]